LRGFADTSPDARLDEPEVAFIGSWSLRKGRADWPHIVRHIREHVPGVRFAFLGTGTPRETVLAELGLDRNCNFVTVVPSYQSFELPRLLATATAGAFPSYAEAFGFGVVELLAAGLPTIAYAASGPRETLEPLSYPALVPVGNANALAGRLAEILRLDRHEYLRQSAESAARATDFHWRDIARATAAAYEEALGALSAGRS
jgi:glycosyltransferase involved in cell wall biosynthesis